MICVEFKIVCDKKDTYVVDKSKQLVDKILEFVKGFCDKENMTYVASGQVATLIEPISAKYSTVSPPEKKEEKEGQ